MLEFSMYEALRMSVVQQFRGAGRMDPVGLVGAIRGEGTGTTCVMAFRVRRCARGRLPA